MAITSVECSDDCILRLLSVGCLVHTEGNLRDLMAVVQIDRALALWHLATTNSLDRRCAVTARHVDVLQVGQVDLGLGWSDSDGCHDCGGFGIRNGMGLERDRLFSKKDGKMTVWG